MNVLSRGTILAIALSLLSGAASAAQTPPPQQQGQGRQGQQGGQAGNPRRPARDTQAQPAPTGTGVIAGAVVSADAGRPVRHARVTLTGGDLRTAQFAATDEQGAFSFTDLPAGRFTLSVSKPGYVNITYGQKKPGRPGTPIQLLDTQKLTSLKLSLPKGGVLTGTVLDENGDPTPGTQVTAFRYEMRTGEKRLVQAGNDQTDDRGVYRIYGLLPGDYVVRATPRNNLSELRQVVQDAAQLLAAAGGRGGMAGGGGRGAMGGGLQQLIGGRGGQAANVLQGLAADMSDPDEAGVGYAPVYFPGTTTSTNALTIALGVGEEHQGVDFQLQLVKTATVSGTVLSPDGDTSGVFLTLVNETEQALGGGLNTTRVQQDGTFTFTNVAPGQYTVQARGGGRGGRFGGRGAGAGGAGAPPEMLWGQSQVTVDGHAVTGMSISLQPGMKVNGRLTFDGGPAPTELTRVRVALAPIGASGPGGLAQNTPAQLDTSGRFMMSGVAPGRYTVRVQGQVQGFTLRSAIVAGRDVLDFPLEVKPNEDVADLTLTMSTRTQELSGTLTDAMNQPATDYSVIVYSAEPQYWTPQSRRIVSVRPGTDGRFTVRSLPPGDYLMAAVTDVEPGEWFDPEFLQQLRGSSVSVSLSEGERRIQDLRLERGQSPFPQVLTHWGRWSSFQDHRPQCVEGCGKGL